MNGFIGEFLIMLGAFKWDPRFVVVAGLGVILSAVYMLWMFQRVYYGEVTNEHNRHMPDLSFREWAIVGPLAPLAICMGVFPNVFLKPMEPAVNRIVAARGAAPAAAGALRHAARHLSHPRTCRTCTHPAHLSHLALRHLMMFAASFDAVIPVLCVALAGLVVLLAESFRLQERAHADRRARRSSACSARASPRCSSGIATPPASASSPPTTSRCSSTSCSSPSGMLTVFFASQTRRARQAAGGRVLRADAVLDRRHDADGAGDRPAAAVPRARDDVDCGLCADRHPARSGRRAPRRRSSTSCSARLPARSFSTASRSSTASPAAPASIASAR